MMDKLFDGSDAHLLPGNAELIQRLNEPELHYPGNFDTVKRANAILMCLCQEAADALEAADKRIAELEAVEQMRDQEIAAIREKHGDALGKLDVARESMRNTYAMLLGATHMGKALTRAEEMLREALVQIGGGE